ncbi:MAG: hypothetical protein ACN6OR_00405, partial [Stenotrophomonas sp.]
VEPVDPDLPKTLNGIMQGFASAYAGNTAVSTSTASFQFDAAAGTFTASIAPESWNGASLSGAGDYLHDRSYEFESNQGSLRVDGSPDLLCSCDYLSWGHWEAINVPGTQPGIPGEDVPPNVAQNGYWIIGKLTPLAELPTNIVASYSGMVIGAAYRDDQVVDGLTGDFTATVNFAAGTGSLNIANFDGHSFGSSFDLGSAASGMPDNAISGTIESTMAAPYFGRYTAGFASDGTDNTAAMLGTFDVREEGGTNWSATGIFAGKKTSETPASGAP